MDTPDNEYAFDLEVAIAAAERWARREYHHEKFEQAARNKHYSNLDTAERCAARANRLLGKLQTTAPDLAEAIATGFDKSISKEIAIAEVTPETINDLLLERVIGVTRDFQSIEFLDQAIFASKSVGRIVNKLTGGRFKYGTGFMVSPRLLMTNHHVLTAADVAAQCTIQFDYQRDRFGQLLPGREFQLDPATFFLNDKNLDFALVAVSPNDSGRPLSDYLWCPLLKEPGKITTGELVNIIQHPKGELKQIVIRENRLVDAFDGAELFLHYEADTEPGSSGSPVFNDQWEVIALHHSGIPKRNSKRELLDTDGKVWRTGDDPSRLQWVANEGVRVSKIVEFVANASAPGVDKDLLKEFLEAKRAVEVPPPVAIKPPIDNPLDKEVNVSDATKVNAARSVTLTVPLHITLTLGVPGSEVTPAISIAGVAKSEEDESLLEKVEIDPNFKRRPGYDPRFLGFNVPFPRLTNMSRPKAYALPGLEGDDRFHLKYYHYSVIFNKERHLAYVAGVNFDPTAKFHHKRDQKDEWFYDPRIEPEELQAGEDLYANNPLDRGHLVRRADAGWGQTETEAKLANDDTFHFTNCSPQHAITNQGKKEIKDRGRVIKAPPGLKLWGKLEDYIAAQGKQEKQKLCVFNGPVFRPSDQEYRGILIPQEFWKVVVFGNDHKEPTVVAFLLTQADLIEDLGEEFEVGEYKAVQVRIRDLETKTHLDFGPFRDWDALEREEARESFTGEYPAVVLASAQDMVL